ncbi:MAG: polysaccharide deacetylase, partial [Dehalococcoidia bacterium]
AGPDGTLPDLPGTMTMGEYGPKTGLPRILQLLDDYDIKASFFVPGYVAETHPDMVRDLVARGHEVAHHGYMHESPAELTIDREREVLEKGIDILVKLTGEKPKGYRAPSWDMSKYTGSLLAEYGFLYDSSLMDDDAPYIWHTEGGDLVELPIHWLLDDFPYYGYAPAFNLRGPMCSPVSVFKTWAAEFDGLYKEGRCYILTTHPQIIGHPGRLSGLERTVQHIRTHPNVKFMRTVDIAEYWVSRGSSQEG